MNSKTQVIIRPSLVEYRTPAGFGIRVVRIYTATETLRLVAYTETEEGKSPMGLFEDEVREYFEDARERRV